MLLTLLFQSKINNNNNNNRALLLLLWKGPRQRNSPGSGKGKKSVINKGDKGGRLTTAAIGIEGFFFSYSAPF